MKRSDWALIALIVVVVGIISYVAVNSIVPPPTANPVEVETAQKINVDVSEPNTEIFNANAINPTVKVKIGGSADLQPFGSGQ